MVYVANFFPILFIVCEYLYKIGEPASAAQGHFDEWGRFGCWCCLYFVSSMVAFVHFIQCDVGTSMK